MAATESPPPTMEVAPRFAAIASAIFMVPRANGATSNTPIGPFHTMVFAPAICFAEMRQSFPGQYPVPSGRPECLARFLPCWVFAMASIFSATTLSKGSSSRIFLLCASCKSDLARSTLSSSTSDLPTCLPCSFQECIGHRAADQQRIHLGQQIADHINLV